MTKMRHIPGAAFAAMAVLLLFISEAAALEPMTNREMGGVTAQGGISLALDEFTICMERRGEAASLFLDDLPTYRYVAPLYYWLGVAQQELFMSAAATANFEAFLQLRPNGGVLVEDASRRLSK